MPKEILQYKFKGKEKRGKPWERWNQHIKYEEA
jgi:hypothetical protein